MLSKRQAIHVETEAKAVDTEMPAVANQTKLMATEKTVVCGGEDKNVPTESIPLPKAVGEENFKDCDRFFKLLTDKKRKG